MSKLEEEPVHPACAGRGNHQNAGDRFDDRIRPHGPHLTELSEWTLTTSGRSQVHGSANRAGDDNRVSKTNAPGTFDRFDPNALYMITSATKSGMGARGPGAQFSPSRQPGTQTVDVMSPWRQTRQCCWSRIRSATSAS